MTSFVIIYILSFESLKDLTYFSSSSVLMTMHMLCIIYIQYHTFVINYIVYDWFLLHSFFLPS